MNINNFLLKYRNNKLIYAWETFPFLSSFFQWKMSAWIELRKISEKCYNPCIVSYRQRNNNEKSAEKDFCGVAVGEKIPQHQFIVYLLFIPCAQLTVNWMVLNSFFTHFFVSSWASRGWKTFLIFFYFNFLKIFLKIEF